MAKLAVLQEDYSRAMKRDYPRHRMPKGTVWNLVDFIPNLGAPLRKRGGYAYASSSLSTISAGSTYVLAGLEASFAAGTQNVAIDEDGVVYNIASSGSAASGGSVTGTMPVQNPVFHRNIVIIPMGDGTTAPFRYNGTAGTGVSALSGSPPAAMYGTVYKDRTVLFRTDAQKERAYFSAAGDPTSWDTTNRFIDISFPGSGISALRNSLLLFSNGHASRLRGTTPPSTAGGVGDFILDDPIFEVGCTDARSIALYGDNCIFANPGGVWLTDGTALADLTEECGVKTYWQDTLASYASTYTLAASIYRNFYMVCIMDGTTFKDFVVFDLPRRTFWRCATIDARAMWHAVSLAEELYFGRRGAPRVGKISTLFSPSATVKNDADGTAVAPVMETGFYEDKEMLKSWRYLFVGYDIRDAAADDPTLTVSYVKTPEATSYTALTPTLSESTKFARSKIPVRFSSYGVGLKIAQTNASSDTRLYGLAADVHTREPSRV